jgi:hypothetical protein
MAETADFVIELHDLFVDRVAVKPSVHDVLVRLTRIGGRRDAVRLAEVEGNIP